jgi:2-octaprenylphenol hydroxylase
MTQQQFDVIVVGAGMVGAALALALGRHGFKVALVDAHAPQLEWPQDGYDIRVSAITRASQQVFESLGAWSVMQAERISPYRDMHVWDAGGDGVIHFDSAEIGEPDLGHIIENRVIIKGLHHCLTEQKNVTPFWPVQSTRLSLNASHARLILADGTELQARLLVGADGARSWVRQQAGISVKGWDYDQVALVTWVKPEKFHEETAWQRFLATGPLAFLPLTNGYCSIVWSTSPTHAAQLQAMDSDRFAQELQAAFENKLGVIEEVGPRAMFPLRSFETQHYILPRLALVGDAAHTIHPLAGQGVNLGLADMASLVQVLTEAQQQQRDIGSEKTLRRYERWRRADNRSMLITMDGFKRLFSTDQSLLRWVRNMGLNLTDRLPPIKRLIMQQALGRDVPHI